MTDYCVLPAFSITQAGDLARRLFDLDGSLQALDGERDLNFLVSTERGKFVFKIANRQEQYSMLECQHQVLQILARSGLWQKPVMSIESINGKPIESVTSEAGETHYCRVLPYSEGRLLSSVHPHTPELLYDLGKKLALMDRSLQDFKHEALQRPLLWRMTDALETLQRFKPLLASSGKRALVEHFESHFRRQVLPISDDLRQSAIHNDANDNNLLVSGDSAWDQEISAIIDFGDMVYSWTVAEPAIAAAYAMLGKQHPLACAATIVKGYHAHLPLTEPEIGVLFDLIGMRLCMSVCICAYQRSLEPDNEYLSISEAPAWALLQKLKDVPHDFAHFVFRDACGLEPVPNCMAVTLWLSNHQNEFAPIVDPNLRKDPLLVLDTGVSSSLFTAPKDASDSAALTRKIDRAMEDIDCRVAIGRYDEYRLVYGGDAYVDVDGHPRRLHLGIDIFMPAASAVYAPLPATVFSIANHDQAFDYGGTVILQHQIQQNDRSALVFHTLYGHLSPDSLGSIAIGDTVNAGQLIGRMGTINENGNWPPHLHFEIITDLLGETDTFVGVGSADYRNVWCSLCPDPNLILGIPRVKLEIPKAQADQIYRERQASINPSLSLSYREPIHLLRGSGQYLFDATGRPYLDAVNNVPHVGHCHPKVVAAGNAQAALLNTNSRYLYSIMTHYSEKLLAKFPQQLSVCFFTNSGSEANDLALRLARHYTQRRDIVILDHAYHGNLSSLIEISPYKHDGKGGTGKPRHVHRASMPDTYRGEFRANETEAAARYAKKLKDELQAAQAQGGAAAFMCESLLGCGGQVVLPEGYLQAAYAHARAAGALCIADEVQVGFGRVGTHFWGFETQQVVPDIVTLAKPIGNGHPLGAVITTREIADAFNNGMEYFNTFGGNPVSCAIGNAVLDVIEDEQLQANADKIGGYLLEGLRALKQEFEIIGDVRGLGLFIGIELVKDRDSLAPAAAQASYIAERMKQSSVLIGTDGPLHNVLKIKPPMCFDRADADSLLAVLESVLGEDFAQYNR